MNEKALKIIELAKARIGEPYVFGAYGEACTPANRNRRARADYPSIINRCQVLTHKAATCEGCEWEGKQIYDCRGFTYWILKQVGVSISSIGATTQYNTASDWVKRGNIREMPDLVCCVFKQKDGKMSHTGLHIGGGVIIHCSTVVKYGKTSDSGWTHYAIPVGLYSDEELAAAEIVPDPVSYDTIKRGYKGEQVKQLQNDLISLGYTLPRHGADGSFGVETETAVKAFQHDSGLIEDGIVGPLTSAALEKALADKEADPVLYSVTIPNLDEAKMQALIAQFPAALVVKST